MATGSAHEPPVDPSTEGTPHGGTNVTESHPSRERIPLHPIGLRILLALFDGPTFGTRIVERIEAAEPELTLYPANLYRRIRDLLDAGLIEEAPAPADADPRRRYVRLTGSGRAVARAEARRLESLVAEARRHRLLSEG